MAPRILIMKSAFKNIAEDVMRTAKMHGFETVFCAPQSQQEYMEYFKAGDIKIIINTWSNGRTFGGYTNDMIRAIAASGVKAVCHEGAGYDVVGDTDLWRECGVQVSNCPVAPAPDTADTAIFLLIGSMRQFYSFSHSIRQGNWRGLSIPAKSTVGATLGILGMGNIGLLIRDRAAQLGFSKILYHQRRRVSAELEKDSVFVPDLAEFLGQCDAIVIVVPHNKATHHLINRERLFNDVKRGCSIINVARGPIIDEGALVEALNANIIDSVGLDVFENEPEVHPGLIDHERAFLLPHVGSHTAYALDAFELEVFDNMKHYIATGHVKNLVN